jgi:2-polyprenyl-6-methoxyphenol hydroxylase-like FAD-dependent oxidoreductase
MFGHRKTEVLVVGAGPTGLLTALKLAEAGVGVEIIEEEPQTAGHSYALALHPASLQRLDEIGLATEAIAKGRRVEGLAIYEGTERRASLQIGDARHPLLALPQSAFEALLSERLAKKKVPVHWGHRLARLEIGSAGIKATVHRLERETTGYAVARTGWVVDKEFQYDAAYIVGADGHGSLVRRILEIPFEETGPSQVYATFECAPRGERVEEMRLVLAEDTANALWPLPRSRARFSLEIDAPEVSAQERFKSRLVTQVGERFFHQLNEEEIRPLVKARAPWFDYDPESFGWSIELRFERRLAASFGRGRAWLAGDAAHLTGPAGLQSMNSGLREASDLAACLAEILRHRGAPDRLEEYGRARLAEWRFLLGRAGGLKPGPSTPAFAAQHAARLLACLPGTDEGLDALAVQIGLQPVRT